MPRMSFAMKLPKDVLDRLDAEIRRCHYAQNAEVSAWLAAQGYRASKSTVQTYSAALKKHDGLTHTSGSLRAVMEQKAIDRATER